MCVYSMISDHFYDKWNPWPNYPEPWKPNPYAPQPPVKIPSKEDIDEFYKLLERAREYDKRTGQPDCDLEDKKVKLRKLAEELGITIEFP